MSNVKSACSPCEQLEWFRGNFRPHFNEWVFGPIERLTPSRDALIGFIFMACAIDYLTGFRWGASNQSKVRKAYVEFIEEFFPAGKYDAEGLYESLRNGLVHMFTIRNKKYGLVHNRSDLHLKTNKSGHLILNAEDFRNDLEAAKEKYFEAVESSPELLAKLVERYDRDGFLEAWTVELPEPVGETASQDEVSSQ